MGMRAQENEGNKQTRKMLHLPCWVAGRKGNRCEDTLSFSGINLRNDNLVLIFFSSCL